jgi:hypothetical protein
MQFHMSDILWNTRISSVFAVDENLERHCCSFLSPSQLLFCSVGSSIERGWIGVLISTPGPMCVLIAYCTSYTRTYSYEWVLSPSWNLNNSTVTFLHTSQRVLTACRNTVLYCRYWSLRILYARNTRKGAKRTPLTAKSTFTVVLRSLLCLSVSSAWDVGEKPLLQIWRTKVELSSW